jgi:hypothetical protein
LPAPRPRLAGSAPRARAGGLRHALRPGSFELTASLDCATDPALTVVGPVRLEMNGFRIVCTLNTLDGIIVQGTGAKLSRGAVSGCDEGIRGPGGGTPPRSFRAIIGPASASGRRAIVVAPTRREGVA